MERSSRKRPAAALQDEHSRRIFRNDLNGQSAWDRHRAYVARYVQVYERDGGKGRKAELDAKTRNDWDVLKERHRFLRDDDLEADNDRAQGKGYEDEVARRYYNHLFKEYAIADLKHYKSGNLALRWRSEEDVVDGIGQFTCANTRCEHHRRIQSSPSPLQLTPYEVNFAYSEQSREGASSSGSGSTTVARNALVKIVLCRRCSQKLKYKGERDKKARQSRGQGERE